VTPVCDFISKNKQAAKHIRPSEQENSRLHIPWWQKLSAQMAWICWTGAIWRLLAEFDGRNLRHISTNWLDSIS